MTSFHVNVGHRFAKPYESDYAIVRRCLSVNPGIGWAGINANLRASNPNAGSQVARVRQLQVPCAKTTSGVFSDALVNTSYRRQCPVCARGGYHSDIYLVPWLARCPLHHCQFTDRCPVCAQPWPALNRLTSRECRGCGLLTWEQLSRSADHGVYEAVGAIYKFASGAHRAHELCGGYGRMGLPTSCEHWWCEIAIDSALFAACQAHRSRAFSAAQLDALHITRPSIQARTTSLTPIDGQALDPVLPRRAPDCLDLARTSQRRLLQDFTVMRAIIEWIGAYTHAHRIHIASYRNLRSVHFLEAPEPCLYCLALSLWFFRTAAKRYGRFYAERLTCYPFFAASEANAFFDVWEPYVRVAGSERLFFTDASFTRWFYRRGLELLFVHLLRFVCDWHRRFEAYCLHRSAGAYHCSCLGVATKDRDCATGIRDGKFIFLYEREHPLEYYQPPISVQTDPRCARFHCYLAGNDDVGSHFDWTVPQGEFTYEAFMTLHQTYRDFLRQTILQGTRWGHLR